MTAKADALNQEWDIKVFIAFYKFSVTELKVELAPVGVQMTYANANNAAQVQHNMNQASALQQDFQAVREKNDAELKQKQVRNKEEAEGRVIKDDPERNGRNGGSYYRSQREPQVFEDEDDVYAVDPRRGHFLDISL